MIPQIRANVRLMSGQNSPDNSPDKWTVFQPTVAPAESFPTKEEARKFADSLGVPVFELLDCLSCGEKCVDHYMVHNPLWKSVIPIGLGLLHLRCLETELGRKLTLEDFTDAPVNDGIRFGFERGSDVR